MVVAAAIQDHGLQVDKFIMLDSAIPAEAFDPSLADYNSANHLVHADWTGYPSQSWAARWHEFYNSDPDDSRGKLTWKGRFSRVCPVAVNFYSSGDEVLGAKRFLCTPAPHKPPAAVPRPGGRRTRRVGLTCRVRGARAGTSSRSATRSCPAA